MKKSNLVTLLSLCFLVIAMILFMSFWKTPSGSPDTTTENKSVTPGDPVSVPKDISEEITTDKKTTDEKTTDDKTTHSQNDLSMDDALFIGDSRTVGLMEYAGVDEADYYCTVGMSVYNIHKNPASVPGVGKVTLTELLNRKEYGKVYIMLGINEVGYKFSSTVEKYSELLELVKDKQSDAVIFIQANLHVSKSRSDGDKVVNNTAINGLNAELAKLADGKSIFYLDANTLFDDEAGGLSADRSGDGTHLYAKYYKEWGEWIVRQTASLIGEE